MHNQKDILTHDDFRRIARFIQEVLVLKNIPRAGWLKLGIKNPETVAEHSMTSALISFILAFLETSNFQLATKAALISLLHDLPEARTMDIHKLARRYVNVDSEKALDDQLSLLPATLTSILRNSREEVKKFVEDADKLELIFQACEYSKFQSEAGEYIKNVELETESAKKIKEALEVERSWWLYFE